MDFHKRFMLAGVLAGFALAAPLAPAAADKLDDVINAGKVRCAVVLDFPPIGYYDENNEPAGFDVEYCKDLANALGVDFELMPVTWAERLPAIVSNRADVVFGGTSDSLERAKTVGFTIPYAIYYAQAVVGKDSGIVTFEDMKGKRVANTAVKPIAEKYDSIIAGPRMPWTTDYTSVVGPRKDFGWLNYLNLFITHQVRSGRYQELWGEFVGGEAPELRIPGVFY